ncbi:MAG: Gfo/Idh/MocA family oxidoreductase [bacterium]|nr:Gfo/Idh/MocA family oxidoreductase [bacterium]
MGMRVVLAGCGSISEAWLKPAQIMPEIEMVGFVDLRPEAAERRAREYGTADAITGTDLDGVLAQTRPDVVFDCTNPDAHYGVVLTALQHGCHVLGEKPLATSMQQAREMIAAAQQAGKVYAIVQNRRYDSNIRRLKALLDSGALGSVTTINSDFYVGAHFRDFRDYMPHILLLDMAIHTFDAARYLAGADPVSVFCKEWNPPGSWYDRDASAVAIFDFSNGVVYTYRGSWTSEGLRTTWESDWRVIGQQGSIVWDGAEGFRGEIATDEGGFFSSMREVLPPQVAAGARVGGHAGVIADFIDCLRTGRTPETIASDNIKSLAMVFAAIQSAETGCVVPVEW